MLGESRREISQQARTLVEGLTQSSFEAAMGSHEAGATLVFSFIPSGQDEGPKIPITHEVLTSQGLTESERMALTLGHHFFSDYGRNFGVGSNILIGWENEHLSSFVAYMAKGLNGILNSKGQFGGEILENLTKANESYLKLVDWAIDH